MKNGLRKGWNSGKNNFIIIMKTCTQCQSSFEVTEKDRTFYDHVSPVFNGKKYTIPEPTLCPLCRSQRRIAFRNERCIYKRKCSMTGNGIISAYRPDTPFPVYSPAVWYSDKWDPLEYGQDYDFSRPFFEQFSELKNKVPKLSLISSNNINSDFCNIVGDSKNCYLIFGSIECEDCMYGNPFRCKSCVDVLITRNCELCYECVDCESLYQCKYCQDCSNSSNLDYCFDVNGSKECFLCAGLKKKEYHILNKPYSPEEYQKKKDELKEKTHDELLEKLKSLKEITPVKCTVGFNNECISGDHVHHSKNCRNLFFSENCEDVHNGYQILDEHNCMDVDYGEKGEFIYELSGHYKANSVIFSVFCWENVSNLIYCMDCTKNTKNCFGCIGLKHKEYCIFNKQYSKEEYEKMVPKIIEQMISDNEYGEFFPIKISPFSYNETVANESFPMTKEDVIKKGWSWLDDHQEIGNFSKTIPANRLPDDIKQIPDDILNWAIQCEKTGHLFKLQPQELKFYRQNDISVPHLHPNERHKKRMALRNPRKLFDRKCDKCETEIKTTYSPDRPEKVHCEPCYLKEVY